MIYKFCNWNEIKNEITRYVTKMECNFWLNKWNWMIFSVKFSWNVQLTESHQIVAIGAFNAKLHWIWIDILWLKIILAILCDFFCFLFFVSL